MTIDLHGFIPPPADGSVPPALAVDFHLEHNPNHAFAILHDVNDSSQTAITYRQLAHAVHRTAHILNPNNTIPHGTSVGILVSAHTIQYVVLLLGAMRAGLVPFPLSPRNQLSGLAHLLTSTQTSYIIAGGGKAIDVVTAQLENLLTRTGPDIKFIQLPRLEDILPGLGQSKAQDDYEHRPFVPLQPLTDKSIVFILHSSGSTDLPKPIRHHLEGTLKNLINQPLIQSYGGPGVRLGLMGLPTFHSMGTALQALAPLYVGYTQVLFAPSDTPVVPTANVTMQAVVGAKCTHLISVPTFLEAWAQDQGAISHLQKLKNIVFGGGPLASNVGNKLVSQGVRLVCGYGATEVGTPSEPHDGGKQDLDDWAYLTFSKDAEVRFVPQYDEDNTHELVFIATETHVPFTLNSEIEGRQAYRTKDLLVQHPSKPEMWKIVGRLDDQIVLLNGEKTNPVPMENEIAKSPLVRHAIMFGRERNQTGVLIELEESASTKYDFRKDHASLVEEIWPYIEHANQTSPSHSRLDKSTIIFVDPAHLLPRTAKGTIARAAATRSYGHQIEDMYAMLDAGNGILSGIEAPKSWGDQEIMEAWVGKCVGSIMGREVDVVGDLFQQGMDSLTAAILLRTLKGVLHSSENVKTRAAAKKFDQQSIFGNPTVRQLAALITQLCTDAAPLLGAVDENLGNISAMIRKYDTDRNIKPSAGIMETRSVAEKERVVVTGTTGGLGSYLLAQLLESDMVEKIWALNRRSISGQGSKERQCASFEDKMLNVALLESEKLVLLDSDLEDTKLGVETEMYEEIRNEATIIIHNAWQVNFNLSLQSFEPSIRSARNLLDLARGSSAPTGPPRFAFASSISVAMGEDLEVLQTEVAGSFGSKSSFGYRESKIVAERLLDSARSAGLQTCSFRIGQLTGDLKSGAWNVTDWVPSIIGSSVSVGCLPEAIGTVSWIPLDIAAQSIIETCTNRNADMPPITNIIHPRPVAWKSIMNAFSDVLASRSNARTTVLPIVPFNEWNKRVNERTLSLKVPDKKRHRRFPSTKIQSMIDNVAYADENLRLRTETNNDVLTGVLRDANNAVGSAEELRREHVEKWVQYWETKGLFI